MQQGDQARVCGVLQLVVERVFRSQLSVVRSFWCLQNKANIGPFVFTQNIWRAALKF